MNTIIMIFVSLAIDLQETKQWLQAESQSVTMDLPMYIVTVQ